MSPPPVILICDHRGAGLAERVMPLAALGLTLEHSHQVRTTRDRVSELQPDVVVLDPLVEGGRAEVEELLAGRGQDQAIPLLLLFDPTRPEPAIGTCAELRPPLFDLVQRNATTEELRLRIERLLALDERRDELADLRYRAIHDDRTDLLRPRAFQQRLTEHYSAAERHKLHLALVLVDLDRFGEVNKRFDHTVGDRIIAKVGEVIRASLRTEDVAGRLGGDEFAVLLPYTEKVDAALVTRRLCDRIRAVSGRFPGANDDIQVSASLGFETFDGSDVEDSDAFRAHAEVALRAAKRAGGDRGVYYRALPGELAS
jgi:diguanylate cyclase (GGDEF)-like protein